MKKVILIALLVMPALALADLNWPPSMSANKKQQCTEGFGYFSENQYCMNVQCESKYSQSVLTKKMEFVNEGYTVSERTHYSNHECYFTYSR
jgi:hypothetical protein